MPSDAATFFMTTSLVIGIIAGFVMHRSDYCVAGMFRDAVMFRDYSMLRALVLQIVVTMILFEALHLLDLLPLYPFPILGKPSLANIAGGILFGIGMVLAGGCVVGTLYKMGAGSVVSFAAFCGLILGSGLYAEIHPQWAALTKATTLSDALTLPQLLPVASSLALVIAGSLAAAGLFTRWRRKGLWRLETVASGYIQPWRTGLVLAVLGTISYGLLGMPIGISTAYTKIAAMLEAFIAPAHVAGLAFYQAEPLHVYHATTHTFLRGGAGPARDALWAIQAPLVVGIVGGSWFSAVRLGEFNVRFRVPGHQLLTALAGGIIMGLASRMVPGCNVWHLMGGLPIFALQSILFLVGLVPGTWLGGKILFHIISKNNTGAFCNRCP